LTEVVSVRFKNKGKVYFFDPAGATARSGDHLIVDTAKGQEYAECVIGNHEVEDGAVRPPLRPVVRVATGEDAKRAEDNRRREKEAFRICREKIAKHGLDMKLVDVEYNFDGNKILFFFTSEGRVDFRELVKDLASVFKTRIELRQIGVRDEARMLGGVGICGKPFCCAQFLDDFQPVSIKMAKTQGLSLNPAKISGTCGRLMCCLKYEQEAYEDLVKNVPKVDSFVETPAGKGSVTDVNLLKGTVRVRLEDQAELTIKTFDASEVTVLGGKAKRAEYLALRAEGKIPDARPAPRFRRPMAAQNPSAPQGASSAPRPEDRPAQTAAQPAAPAGAERPAPSAPQKRRFPKPHAPDDRPPRPDDRPRTDDRPRPPRPPRPAGQPGQDAASPAQPGFRKPGRGNNHHRGGGKFRRAPGETPQNGAPTAPSAPPSAPAAAPAPQAPSAPSASPKKPDGE